MTTLPDFLIRDLTVIDGAPNVAGNRLLATFTLGTSAIAIRGCVLIEKASGIVRVGGPAGKTTKGFAVGAQITDEAFSRAVARRAAAAYSALTGREVFDE